MHETTKASIRTGEEGSRLLRDDKNCNYANWLRNIGIYVSREREMLFSEYNSSLLADRESFLVPSLISFE